MVEQGGSRGVTQTADGMGKMKNNQKTLSKRQRRKQPNDKHKWPQHPKIQSMDARQKAYIRVAGLGSSKKQKEAMDPKLDLMSPEVKFGRLLGGTDQRKRHAAVNKLKMYLRARCDINNESGGISEMDLMKLWKGLWYTLFMADKVAVQDELSNRLAELLWCVAGTEEEDEYAGQAYMDMCRAEEGENDDDSDDGEDVQMEEIVNTLDEEGDSNDSDEDDDEEESDEDEDDDSDEQEQQEQGDSDGSEDDIEDDEQLDTAEIPHCRGAHLASLFIRVFFRTVRREWGNMDKYRVDKFYTLIRLYMHQVFKYMASRHWNLGIIRMFNDSIYEEILSQTPNGIRYHLIDLAVDELAKVNSKAPMPLTEATFLDTLEPYFAMCQTGGGDDTIQGRVMEKVLERFLLEYSVVSDRAVEERANNEQDQSIVFDQVHVGTVGQMIFQLASDPETKDQYRKSLYEMHKTFCRRLKKIDIDVEIEQNSDDAAEEEEEMFAQEEEEDASEDDASYQEEAGDIVRVSAEKNHNEASSKKKRKRKDGGKEKREVEEPNAKGERGKKKSKMVARTGKETQPLEKSRTEEPDDEMVTISLSEQQRAKSQHKKSKKKQPSAQNEEKSSKQSVDKSERRDRRVQFGEVNTSKSYKASMKALVTRELPKTSNVSPERGILLNKGRKIPKAGKKQRKRATSYF